MTVSRLIDHRVFFWTNGAMLLAAVALLVWSIATAHWGDAIALGAIAVVLGAILYERSKLPSLLGLLLAIAAAVNGAGYALQLWHDETLFDEIVHFFTTFVGMLAIGWSVRNRDILAQSPTKLAISVVAIGLALGVVWEIFEWAIGIIGRPRDTAIDLLMDGAGALVAAAILWWLVPRNRFSDR